jgi:hypothetical protein
MIGNGRHIGMMLQRNSDSTGPGLPGRNCHIGGRIIGKALRAPAEHGES